MAGRRRPHVAATPPLAAWTDPDRADVQSDVLSMADQSNRLARLSVDGAPAASGVVLLGDAAMCTNPGYGRGVGLALVHARGLAGVLEEVDDPEAVTTAFEEFTRTELEPWFHAAVASDRVRLSIGRRVVAGEPLQSIGGPGDDPTVRFARGAPHTAERDPVVRRALHRCFQLLDPPSEYWGSADIHARVDEVWRHIEGAPPPPPGPDYETMGRLLSTAIG